MVKKLFYTWENFENDIDKILVMIKKLKIKPKVIYGIPKGGLPLAVKLANVLQLPLALNLFSAISQVKNKKEVLIVDDIADSGNTLLQIPFVRNYNVLCLFVRYKTKIRPNMFVTELFNDKWIVFCWEDTKNIKEERDGTEVK